MLIYIMQEINDYERHKIYLINIVFSTQLALAILAFIRTTHWR